MCGIFGYIKGKKNIFMSSSSFQQGQGFNSGFNQEDDFLETLLHVSMLRGIDSTGFIIVDNNKKETSIYKAPVNALDFKRLGEYSSVKSDIVGSNRGLIGHVRKTTVGNNSYRTSHPMQFNDLVGVHNGTLYNWNSLWPRGKSDSEALYHALSETEDYVGIISELSGAYALVFYNTDTGKYYFVRNKDRPLWCIKSDDILFFSSEKRFITFSLERTLGHTKAEGILKDSETFEFKEKEFYEFDPNNFEFQSSKLPEPKIKVTTYYPTKSNIPFKGHTKTVEISPFKREEVIEFIPCKYDINHNGSGTVHGVIPHGDKYYYCVVYSVPRVKEWWESFETFNSYIFGKIRGIYSVRNRPFLQNPLSRTRIFPELLDNDECIVHSIDYQSVFIVEEGDCDDAVG